MQNKKYLCVLFFVVLSLLLLAHLSVYAFENITTKEAYEMVCKGDAALIDIRTIEEAVFVGVPSCKPSSEQLAYLIPFNIWDGSIPVIEPNKLPRNPEFLKLIENTFSDKEKSAYYYVS